MNETPIPAPPFLTAKPEQTPAGNDRVRTLDDQAPPTLPATGRQALFTATSRRSELVSAYPELEAVCARLGFGSEASLGEWSTDPTWALLILARAAQAPPPTPVFDWSQAEIFELVVDLIDHHHCPLRNELRRLGLLIREFVLRHPETGFLDCDGAFARLEVTLIEHLDHEEQTVFPHCLANESASHGHAAGDGEAAEITIGIREMMSGHNYGSGEVSSLLAQVAAAARLAADSDLEAIRLGLQAMAADLVIHADKERDILMPAAIFAEEQLRSKHGDHE